MQDVATVCSVYFRLIDPASCKACVTIRGSRGTVSGSSESTGMPLGETAGDLEKDLMDRHYSLTWHLVHDQGYGGREGALVGLVK